MYVLDYLSIAEMDEMEAVCKVFDALDHLNNGTLTLQHVRRRLQHVVEPRSYRPYDPAAYGITPERGCTEQRESVRRLAKYAYRSDTRRSAALPSHQQPLLPTTGPSTSPLPPLPPQRPPVDPRRAAPSRMSSRRKYEINEEWLNPNEAQAVVDNAQSAKLPRKQRTEERVPACKAAEGAARD
jgi:hypothetical protein